MRLDKELAKDFIEQIKKEFQESEEHGFLKKDYFPRRWWVALKAILKVPLGATLFALRLRKMISK